MPFRPSTSYSAEVNPGLFLAERQNFSGRRKVEFFHPQDQGGERDAQPENAGTANRRGLVAGIRIAFNHPVDHEELQKHLQLRFQGGQPLDFHLQTEENGRSFLFRSEPLARTDRQQVIELSLPRGFPRARRRPGPRR